MNFNLKIVKFLCLAAYHYNIIQNFTVYFANNEKCCNIIEILIKFSASQTFKKTKLVICYYQRYFNYKTYDIGFARLEKLQNAKKIISREEAPHFKCTIY